MPISANPRRAQPLHPQNEAGEATSFPRPYSRTQHRKDTHGTEEN